jgi:hypothetical protein
MFDHFPGGYAWPLFPGGQGVLVEVIQTTLFGLGLVAAAAPIWLAALLGGADHPTPPTEEPAPSRNSLEARRPAKASPVARSSPSEPARLYREYPIDADSIVPVSRSGAA